MVDFALTEEQKALRKMAREFAEREIKPVAAEYDRRQDPRECFPWDIVEKGSRLGLRTLALPREYGGGGVEDHLTQYIVLEELVAAGDPGAAKIFGQAWKFGGFVLKAASREQKERYLPAFAKDHRFLLASGITEPDLGSDHVFPVDAPPEVVRMRTTARREGKYYLVNGRKQFIALGAVAKLTLLFANTNPSERMLKGTSLFLVEAGTPGFSIGKIHDKLGQRLYQQAELVFEDARVPAENLVGEEGQAFPIKREVSRTGALELGVVAVGIARAAFEAALAYAKQRVQGGKPIIEHQAVGLMLADMGMLVEAARALAWRAAWEVDHAENFDRKLSYYVKVFNSEACIKVASHAVEIFGGAGYMKEAPVEKILRDAYYTLHPSGTNQINRLKAVRAMRG